MQRTVHPATNAGMQSPTARGAELSTQVHRPQYFFRELHARVRSGVWIAYGGSEHCNADYAIHRRNFRYPTLEFVTAGRGRVAIDGQSYALHAGTLFHYDFRSQVEIHTDAAQPLTKYFLCFTGSGVRARLEHAGLRPGIVLQLTRFVEIQRIFDELIREAQHPRPITDQICETLVELLLLKIEDLAQAPKSSGPADETTYLRCKTLIEDRAPQFHSLSDISRAASIEASQLCRLFKRHGSLSPYQYLLHRKMMIAAEKLMEPGARVKEVAAQVGFPDPYHFSRCFKRVHQSSPRHFQLTFIRNGGTPSGAA